MRLNEINELKRLQAQHIDELKARETDANQVRAQLQILIENQQKISNELATLDIVSTQRHDRISMPHNLRRIKMLLRDRSSAVRHDLRHDIELLARIPVTTQNRQTIELLRDRLEMQFDLEVQKQAQIEAMYESEAKQALLKQQEIWLKESTARVMKLRSLLDEQLKVIAGDIEFNERRLDELKTMRATHRMAVDDATERMRRLQQIDEDDDRISIPELAIDQLSERVEQSARLTPNESVRPQFGRKKVAWT